jgi:hypothetical protein
LWALCVHQRAYRQSVALRSTLKDGTGVYSSIRVVCRQA